MNSPSVFPAVAISRWLSVCIPSVQMRLCTGEIAPPRFAVPWRASLGQPTARGCSNVPTPPAYRLQGSSLCRQGKRGGVHTTHIYYPAPMILTDCRKGNGIYAASRHAPRERVSVGRAERPSGKEKQRADQPRGLQ
jgi:hypothetical protein